MSRLRLGPWPACTRYPRSNFLLSNSDTWEDECEGECVWGWVWGWVGVCVQVKASWRVCIANIFGRGVCGCSYGDSNAYLYTYIDIDILLPLRLVLSGISEQMKRYCIVTVFLTKTQNWTLDIKKVYTFPYFQTKTRGILFVAWMHSGGFWVCVLMAAVSTNQWHHRHLDWLILAPFWTRSECWGIVICSNAITHGFQNSSRIRDGLL